MLWISTHAQSNDANLILSRWTLVSDSTKNLSEGNSPGQVTGYLLREIVRRAIAIAQLITYSEKPNSWLTDSVRSAMRLCSPDLIYSRIRKSRIKVKNFHICWYNGFCAKMIDILSIFSGVFMLFLACAVCCCCLRCSVWVCYELWHPREGIVCRLSPIFVKKGYVYFLADLYICFLQLILSNHPPIWLGCDKRFSAIELASFTVRLLNRKSYKLIMQHFCRLYIHTNRFYICIYPSISLIVISAWNGFSALYLFKPNGLQLLFNWLWNGIQELFGAHYSFVYNANCIHSINGNILLLANNTESLINQSLFVFKCTVYYLIVKVCDNKPRPQIHPWDIEREPQPSIGM